MTKKPTLTLLAAITILPLLGRAQEPLPANQWVKVGEKQAGCRKGSIVVWLDNQKQFLVIGGVKSDKWTRESKIPAAYGVMTFDPASRTWEAFKPGEGIGPFKYAKKAMFGTDAKGNMELSSGAGLSGSFAFDPTGGRIFVYRAGQKTFNVTMYDVGTRVWKQVSKTRPPARSDGVWPGEYGFSTCFMEGTSPVFDPVNEELLFIGGRTGNDPEGFVGHWALSIKDKTWRELTTKDALLDGLREKVFAAISPTRDSMAAARNVFYASMTADKEAEAMKTRPVQLAKAAVDNLRIAVEALKAAKAKGWKVKAVMQARTRAEKALADLETARKAFESGTVSAETLRGVFTAAWLLDESVDCLRTVPSARKSAGAGFDPASKSIVVFGGDHGDYLLNDTWVYDCGTKTWRQVFGDIVPKARRAAGKILWLPGQKKLGLAGGTTYKPKFIYFRRDASSYSDVWTFDVPSGKWSLVNAGGGKGPRPSLTCAQAAGDGDVLLGLASKGKWRGITADYWLFRIAPAEADAAKAGTPSGTRTYFTAVKEYNPCWYDGAPRGDRQAVTDGLAKLKPNTWTLVPRAPRPVPQRSWGTIAFDPGRDQWYYWTGGHMSDPSDIVSTYHPAINRWSIPFIASYIGKGVNFRGRPDCMNHTYTNYDYDPSSGKIVFTHLGGTCIYDPDRREFEPRIAHPFRQHPYTTLTVGTPKGVVCRAKGSYLGIFDMKERKWKKLPLKGKLQQPQTDGSGLCYDSKRNMVWMGSLDGYQSPGGRIWRYNLETGVSEELSPKNRATIGKSKKAFRTLREIAYVPTLDMLLFNNFYNGKQVAYDPEQNSWVLLGLGRDSKGGKSLQELGGVNVGLVYDAKRDLVWAQVSKDVLVVKIDPKTVKITREVAAPAPGAPRSTPARK